MSTTVVVSETKHLLLLLLLQLGINCIVAIFNLGEWQPSIGMISWLQKVLNASAFACY